MAVPGLKRKGEKLLPFVEKILVPAAGSYRRLRTFRKRREKERWGEREREREKGREGEGSVGKVYIRRAPLEGRRRWGGGEEGERERERRKSWEGAAAAASAANDPFGDCGLKVFFPPPLRDSPKG